MKYSQAKAEAHIRTQQTRIDHVISFDGKSYSVAMLPRYKGNITEIVKFKKTPKVKYVKPQENEEIPEPVKTSKPKKKSKTS